MSVFNYMNIIDILKDGAEGFGIELSEAHISAFLFYMDELKQWNERMNLTSIRGDEEVAKLHLLDSLSPYGLIREVLGSMESNAGARLLDMGAGGGFPGLPLKIICPELELTLMDSVGKKVNFMRHMIRTLSLEGASAVKARAGEGNITAEYKESFDFVISRAFSNLSAYLKLSLPLTCVGGHILAMKGPGNDILMEELRDVDLLSRVYLDRLEVVERREYSIPFTDRIGTLFLYRKLS